MFDGIIYSLLNWVDKTSAKIREYMIKKSLPKPCISAEEWAKDHKKWKENQK